MNKLSIEMQLRQMLFLHHGHHSPALHGDDGEMQCHECHLDFRRDSPITIEIKLSNPSLNADQVSTLAAFMDNE